MFNAFKPLQDAEQTRVLIPNLLAYSGTDADMKHVLERAASGLLIAQRLSYWSQSEKKWITPKDVVYKDYDSMVQRISRTTYTISKVRRFADMLTVVKDCINDRRFADKSNKHPLLNGVKDLEYTVFQNQLNEFFTNALFKSTLNTIMCDKTCKTLVMNLAQQIDLALYQYCEVLSDSEWNRLLSKCSYLTIPDQAAIEGLHRSYYYPSDVAEPYGKPDPLAIFVTHYHSLSSCSQSVRLDDLARVQNFVNELLPKQKSLFAV